MPDGLSLEDGAATLTEMTAAAVAAAVRHFPAPPREWLVCGGGRRNPAIMAALGRRLGGPVRPVEAVGWDGDALEAQAFAYLAVRSLRGLPLSLPTTTGAPHPVSGGRLFRAPVIRKKRDQNRGRSGCGSRPRWTCSRPSSAQRCKCRKHLAGIEQPVRVEGAFQPLLVREVGFVEHLAHQVALLDADAVLAGQDAADLRRTAAGYRRRTPRRARSVPG